jgi:hypothetical protein
MSKSVQFSIEVPEGLEELRFPAGVQARLDQLLDRQDQGIPLSSEERQEAQGLVDLAELLSLLRMKSERLSAA